jgi:hypothetical protein
MKQEERDSSGNKKRIFTVPAAVVISNQAAVEEAIDAAIVKEVAMEVEADQTERINIQEVDQIQMKNAYSWRHLWRKCNRILEATIITARGSRGDGQGRNNPLPVGTKWKRRRTRIRPQQQ